MSITRQTLEQTLASIEKALSAHGADRQRVDELRRALTGLQWLREQYRLDASPFGPYMDQLMDLGRRVTERIRSSCEMLTGEYVQAGRAINGWQAHRETCRDLLLELARVDGAEGFASKAGRVEVRRVQTLALPPADSDQRQELALLLTEAGQWPAVGQPNGRKLLQAIEEAKFTPDQAERLAALCPVQTVVRLKSLSLR